MKFSGGLSQKHVSAIMCSHRQLVREHLPAVTREAGAKGEAYRQDFIHYHAGEIAGHMEQMAIGPDVSEYGPSDNEAEAYRQDFIHYHVGEIAEHMEQMAIGPDAGDYGADGNRARCQ